MKLNCMIHLALTLMFIPGGLNAMENPLSLQKELSINASLIDHVCKQQEQIGKKTQILKFHTDSELLSLNTRERSPEVAWLCTPTFTAYVSLANKSLHNDGTTVHIKWWVAESHTWVKKIDENDNTECAIGGKPFTFTYTDEDDQDLAQLTITATWNNNAIVKHDENTADKQ